MLTVPNFLHGANLADLASDPSNAFFEIDDVGIIAVLNIHQGYFGVAAVTFWDRRLEDKVVPCKALAELVMESAGLQILTTAVPKSRKRLLKFVLDVGFRFFQEVNNDYCFALLREDTNARPDYSRSGGNGSQRRNGILPESFSESSSESAVGGDSVPDANGAFVRREFA